MSAIRVLGQFLPSDIPDFHADIQMLKDLVQDDLFHLLLLTKLLLNKLTICGPVFGFVVLAALLYCSFALRRS